MKQSGFIVVIDLGTSEIRGLVGRKNDDNIITILGYESVESNRSIRRGLIYNIDEAAAKVRKLLTLLENKLSIKIAKVYVSVAGQSLHSIPHSINKQLSSSGIITENIIEQIHKEADKFLPDMSKKYGIGDVEYIIDEKPELRPVGISATQITANFQMIVGRPNIITNIQKSIAARCQVEIAGYIIGPLASAEITLTDNEKELGCAFIDFGAGTTSIAIYKEGKLRHMAVIPFGGISVTRDICDLNFAESDAELYKVKYGKTHEVAESRLLNAFMSKPDIDLPMLNHIIKMRIDEIVENVAEQIKISGYEDQLGAGIVITGGASQLKNLNLYLKDRFKMPVRQATANKLLINNFAELVNNPSFTQALGLFLYANKDCEKPIVTEPVAIEDSDEKDSEIIEPKPSKQKSGRRGGSFFKSVGLMIGNMFEDDEDDEDDEA